MEASVPGLAPDPGSAAERLVLRLAGRNATVTVPFATEAGHFQAAGVPTVVCGPGNIAVAHKPDEYIEETQMNACDAVLGRLLDRVS
jgi:acetylornithine deacetylase